MAHAILAESGQSFSMRMLDARTVIERRRSRELDREGADGELERGARAAGREGRGHAFASNRLRGRRRRASVVGGVGDATPSNSIFVAVMDVPTLVPLTSSITPAGMFAPVSRSNWVPVSDGDLESANREARRWGRTRRRRGR